ncbi:flagellar hook-length control protein FliK [Afifella pfennigii]|uniref:flagellar hook-length control protein FliK n=1 Tax=Afifella pfennigii TaxID=209897 RepID=UPI00047C0379|nr:flagellar hook-length control protein FliK [Afifella pfennigii]
MNGINFLPAAALPRAERAKSGPMSGEAAGEGAPKDAFLKLLQQLPAGPEGAKPDGMPSQAAMEEGEGSAQDAARGQGEEAVEVLAVAAAAGATAAGEGGKDVKLADFLRLPLDAKPPSEKPAAIGTEMRASASQAQEVASKSPLRFTVAESKTHFAPVFEAARIAGEAGAKLSARQAEGIAAAAGGEAEQGARPLENGLRGEAARAPAAVRGGESLAPAAAATNGEKARGDAPSGERKNRDPGVVTPSSTPGEKTGSVEAALPKEPVPAANGPALASSQLARIASAIGSQMALTPEIQAQRGISGALPFSHAMAGPGPVKSITIQLHPVELGSVKIELRLGQDGLAVRLEASRAETARMLQQDSQMLSDIIRSSGHDPDSIIIHNAPSDRAAGVDAGQTAGNLRAGGQPQGEAGAGTASGGERESSARGEGFEGQRGHQQEAQDGQGTADRRDRRGLFV